MPTVPFEPSWKKYEDKIHSNNIKESVEALDQFQAEREHEITVDPKARKWEEDRKKEVGKEKAYWRKQEDRKLKDQQEKPIKELLYAGTFNNSLDPTPGHILIGIDSNEKMSDSGIVFHIDNASPNIGIVLAIGKPLVCKHCFANARYEDVSKVEQRIDVLPGQKVLFKRGAGLEVDIKGSTARIMAFSDILGVFE